MHWTNNINENKSKREKIIMQRIWRNSILLIDKVFINKERMLSLNMTIKELNICVCVCAEAISWLQFPFAVFLIEFCRYACAQTICHLKNMRQEPGDFFLLHFFIVRKKFSQQQRTKYYSLIITTSTFFSLLDFGI